MTDVTYKKINQMIESLGLPYAYYQFPEGTAEPTPFICFYFSDENGLKADNVNYAKLVTLRIELYTDNKRFDLEEQISNLLTINELPYNKYESYIDTEKMLMQTYETEVFING